MLFQAMSENDKGPELSSYLFDLEHALKPDCVYIYIYIYIYI